MPSNTESGPTSTGTNELTPDPLQDGCKAVQHDNTRGGQNNHHFKVPTHGIGKFLWEVEPEYLELPNGDLDFDRLGSWIHRARAEGELR